MSSQRRTSWGVLVLVAILLATAQVVSAEQPVEQDPVKPQRVHELMATKLLRGVANLLTGWIEFPKQVRVVWVQEGWVTGLTRGPIDGLGMLLARTVGGAYETLTFLLPVPTDFQPLVEPEYVWQPELSSKKEEAIRKDPLQ